MPMLGGVRYPKSRTTWPLVVDGGGEGWWVRKEAREGSKNDEGIPRHLSRSMQSTYAILQVGQLAPRASDTQRVFPGETFPLLQRHGLARDTSALPMNSFFKRIMKHHGISESLQSCPEQVHSPQIEVISTTNQTRPPANAESVLRTVLATAHFAAASPQSMYFRTLQSCAGGISRLNRCTTRAGIALQGTCPS